MNSDTWEGRVHALEHMREQHPGAFVIYVALFMGIVVLLLVGVVLVALPIAIYRTIQNRRKVRDPLGRIRGRTAHTAWVWSCRSITT